MKKEIIGKRFGYLTILKTFKGQYKRHYYAECKCDCGKFIIRRIDSLKRYVSENTSCGCVSYKDNKRVTHNLSKCRLYRIYSGLKQRCYYKKHKDYKEYGGRGIKVCSEWLSDFMNFYNWAINNGYNENLTIDRINVNGNYEPDNCRWITEAEQHYNTRRNRTYTYNGETHCIEDWCKIYKIKRSCLYSRLVDYKWDIEKALTTPPRKKRNINLREYAQILGTSSQNLCNKLKRGTITLDYLNKIANQTT